MVLLARYYFPNVSSKKRNIIENTTKEVVYVPIPVPIYIQQPFVEEKQNEDSTYSNPIRPWEQKIIDQKMDTYLESHPNSDFFKEHPEYVDAYLSRVDISELGLDVKEDE